MPGERPVTLADLGPQSQGDSVFAARMRLHQSWYRHAVLNAGWGTGPRPHDTRELGSMLDAAAGEAGLNFLSPDIHLLARKRMHENPNGVKPFRTSRNMLASQPMCFNLFGPLCLDLKLAAAVFARILPVNLRHVTLGTIEYAPRPASDYLDDATSFDAYFEYELADGSPGFVSIETKLSEPFSPNPYDTPAYRRWSDRPDSPWPANCRAQLAQVRHNQLWRDHLLAWASLKHRDSRFKAGQLLLASHPRDRRCRNVTTGYQKLLKPEDTSFVDCTLDRLVAVIENAASTPRQHDWAQSLRCRYLDLQPSEGLWLEHRAGAAGLTGELPPVDGPESRP